TWIPSPPTWEFQQIPSVKYEALQRIVSTRVQPGLGELIWDGIVPRDLGLAVQSVAKDHREIWISPDLQSLINIPALRTRYPNVQFSILRGSPHLISFSRGLLTPANNAYARQIFYSGAFPVACYDNAESLDVPK